MDQVITCPIEAAYQRMRAKQRAKDEAYSRWIREQEAARIATLDRNALRAELSQLQARLDPEYEMSDDYTFWCKQRDMRARIATIERDLAAA